MTQPGSIIPPQPGWWPRTDHIGVALTPQYGWVSSATGIMHPQGRVAAQYGWSVADTIGHKSSPAYDTTGVGQTAAASSWSWSHTIGSSAKAVVALVSGYTSVTPTMTMTAKVGTTSMTLLAQNQDYFADPNYCSLYLFGLINPPTGTQTITATSSASSDGGGNSVSYNAGSSFGTAVTATGTTGAPSVTVPSASGQLVIGGFGDYTTNFSGLSGTSRFNVAQSSGVNLSFMLQDTPGASSVTLSAASGVAEWCALGVALIP